MSYSNSFNGKTKNQLKSNVNFQNILIFLKTRSSVDDIFFQVYKIKSGFFFLNSLSGTGKTPWPSGGDLDFKVGKHEFKSLSLLSMCVYPLERICIMYLGIIDNVICIL